MITFDRYAQSLAPNGADVPKCELSPPRTRAPEMSSKNLAALSFGTFLSLLAATAVAVFFGTSFLLLTHPWDEMPATRSKTAAATAVIPPAQTDTAAAATTVIPTRADRHGGRGDRELLGLIFCCGLSVTPSPLCRKDREGSETIRSTSDEQRNFPPTVSRCAHTVSKAAAGAA